MLSSKAFFRNFFSVFGFSLFHIHIIHTGLGLTFAIACFLSFLSVRLPLLLLLSASLSLCFSASLSLDLYLYFFSCSLFAWLSLSHSIYYNFFHFLFLSTSETIHLPLFEYCCELLILKFEKISSNRPAIWHTEKEFTKFLTLSGNCIYSLQVRIRNNQFSDVIVCIVVWLNNCLNNSHL